MERFIYSRVNSTKSPAAGEGDVRKFSFLCRSLPFRFWVWGPQALNKVSFHTNQYITYNDLHFFFESGLALYSAWKTFDRHIQHCHKQLLFSSTHYQSLSFITKENLLSTETHVSLWPLVPTHFRFWGDPLTHQQPVNSKHTCPVSESLVSKRSDIGFK